jgi:hypothetical protein
MRESDSSRALWQSASVRLHAVKAQWINAKLAQITRMRPAAGFEGSRCIDRATHHIEEFTDSSSLNYPAHRLCLQIVRRNICNDSKGFRAEGLMHASYAFHARLELAISLRPA